MSIHEIHMGAQAHSIEQEHKKIHASIVVMMKQERMHATRDTKEAKGKHEWMRHDNDNRNIYYYTCLIRLLLFVATSAQFWISIQWSLFVLCSAQHPSFTVPFTLRSSAGCTWPPFNPSLYRTHLRGRKGQSWAAHVRVETAKLLCNRTPRALTSSRFLVWDLRAQSSHMDTNHKTKHVVTVYKRTRASHWRHICSPIAMDSCDMMGWQATPGKTCPPNLYYCSKTKNQLTLQLSGPLSSISSALINDMSGSDAKAVSYYSYRWLSIGWVL